jgi:hypothetical protein
MEDNMEAGNYTDEWGIERLYTIGKNGGLILAPCSFNQQPPIFNLESPAPKPES